MAEINTNEAISAAKAALIALTEDERLLVFSEFCTHCGIDDPLCQCWNDE